MNNIIFVSNYYPSTMMDICKKYSKSGLDFAAHNLNVSIHKGLLLNNQSFFEINHPNIGNFPVHYKKILLDSCVYDSGYSVSFNNLIYYKRNSIAKNIGIKLEEIIPQMNGSPIILLYNFDFISRIDSLKRKFPLVKIVLLVTDLPEFMDVNNSVFTRINKKIRNYSQEKFYDKIAKYIDGFILLAPKMAEKLPVGNKPWIQIEGIYNDEEKEITVEKSKNKLIVYTGNLGYRYGIKDLLKAFELIPDDEYELIFRGAGEAERDIIELAQKDRRIKLLPMLSKKDLFILQKRATLLVNTVNPKQEFSKYFFPSKTLEYMASGTPTLMGRLDCLPKEYLNYLYLIKDFSPEKLKNQIVEICNKPKEELTLFGNNASAFVKKEKTPEVQVKKIIRFLSKL